MRGISEKRLRAILHNQILTPKTQSFIQYLLEDECKELNPWLPLEEFLKSDHEGYCWVCYKGSAEMTIYRHGVFHVVQLDDIVCLSTDYITHVMPIQTPADQKE